MQPCLVNKMEYKVVVFGAEVALTDPNRKATPRSPFHTDDNLSDIMSFARLAVDVLAAGNPGLMRDGLLRVDIMQTRNKRMIVNEFESLEALYACSKQADTHRIELFLIDYWRKKLIHLLEKLT